MTPLFSSSVRNTAPLGGGTSVTGLEEVENTDPDGTLLIGPVGTGNTGPVTGSSNTGLGGKGIWYLGVASYLGRPEVPGACASKTDADPDAS